MPFARDLNHRLSCARAPVVRNVSGLCDGPPVRCAADLRAIKLYGLKRAGTNFLTSFIENNFGTPLLCDRDVYDADGLQNPWYWKHHVWHAGEAVSTPDLEYVKRRRASPKRSRDGTDRWAGVWAALACVGTRATGAPDGGRRQPCETLRWPRHVDAPLDRLALLDTLLGAQPLYVAVVKAPYSSLASRYLADVAWHAPERLARQAAVLASAQPASSLPRTSRAASISAAMQQRRARMALGASNASRAWGALSRARAHLREYDAFLRFWTSLADAAPERVKLVPYEWALLAPRALLRHLAVSLRAEPACGERAVLPSRVFMSHFSTFRNERQQFLAQSYRAALPPQWSAAVNASVDWELVRQLGYGRDDTFDPRRAARLRGRAR